MPRYLLSVNDENAELLERMFGGRVRITRAHGVLPLKGGEPEGGATVAGLDAITEEEAAPVLDRLRHSGPMYHKGGPQGGERTDMTVTWEKVATVSAVTSVPEETTHHQRLEAAEALAERLTGVPGTNGRVMRGTVRWQCKDGTFGGSIA